MSARNVDLKNTNIQPVVSGSEKIGKTETLPETEPIKDKSVRLIASLESKRKLLNLLEGYLGKKNDVSDIKKRIDEALKYLEGLTGEV